MPEMPGISSRFAGAELFLGEIGERLEVLEIFGNAAPLEVDLGCGDGTFLAELAAAFPERNFLGIERLVGRVRSACHKLNQRAITNARVLRADSTSAVTGHLAPRSVSAFRIMFPDPWPKRRHQNRRLITPEFLRLIHHVLEPGGRIYSATDHEVYFRAMNRAADELSPDFSRLTEDEQVAAKSTFEKRFLAAGLPIYRLSLEKPGEGT